MVIADAASIRAEREAADTIECLGARDEVRKPVDPHVVARPVGVEVLGALQGDLSGEKWSDLPQLGPLRNFLNDAMLEGCASPLVAPGARHHANLNQ